MLFRSVAVERFDRLSAAWRRALEDVAMGRVGRHLPAAELTEHRPRERRPVQGADATASVQFLPSSAEASLQSANARNATATIPTAFPPKFIAGRDPKQTFVLIAPRLRRQRSRRIHPLRHRGRRCADSHSAVPPATGQRPRPKQADKQEFFRSRPPTFAPADRQKQAERPVWHRFRPSPRVP